MIRIAMILILFAAAAQAQVKAIIWDTTFVVIDSADVDTIHINFDRSPYKRMIFRNYGSTAPLTATKPGQAVYVPDTMVVVIDTTNVSGAAADSFKVKIIPYNPITGALVVADTTYIRGGSGTFGTLIDGLVLGIPSIRPWYNAWAMIIKRGDFNLGSQRIKASFVRKE